MQSTQVVLSGSLNSPVCTAWFSITSKSETGCDLRTKCPKNQEKALMMREEENVEAFVYTKNCISLKMIYENISEISWRSLFCSGNKMAIFSSEHLG